jgi:ubiquinone/menaquinone biosynthesis C-methylase UbiE
MTAPQETELRTYWRQLWASTEEADSQDIWYAIDEIKFGYLRRFLPSGGRSLEVGCGSARLSRFLAALGFNAVALDCEAAAVRLAGRRFQAGGMVGDLLLGDAFALPFADESFDVVLSTGLLEHFPDPSPIVGEMTRVLRRGGVFYSDIVPKKFSLLRAFDRLSSSCSGPWERPFSKKEIEALLSNAGLRRPTVFAAGILLPPLPVVRRWRFLARLQEKGSLLFYKIARRLDGTRVAEMLGVYYFTCAKKLKRHAGDAASLAARRAA